jgi:uncharacterized protein with beta-barrel porin domain
MAAGTTPIFTLVPEIGANIWLPATTANTKSDGVGTIGTDMLLLFTSGADGSFLNKIRFSPSASVAATATTASVIRVYLSTQSSGATTNANTHLIGEIAAPSQTADQTTTATNYLELPLGFAIQTGYSVLFSMHHAAAANTSWKGVCFAGDY